MGSVETSGFKRFLWWDYPRASWQYDLIVGLILAFIFLTPREFFRDQPRAANVVQVSTSGASTVFWVEPDLLHSVPEPARAAKVEQLLKSRFGKKESVVRLEPIFGNEREIKGYMAFVKP